MQPPKCTDGPFCCTARDANTLFAPTTLLLMLHNPRPLSEWTSASGDKSFGRDVFSRDARQRHHLMCILAAEPNYYRCTRPTLFVLQLQGLGTGSGEHLVVGIQLYDRLRFCAGYHCPDSSGLGNSNCGAAHTRKQQPQKTCRGS